MRPVASPPEAGAPARPRRLGAAARVDLAGVLLLAAAVGWTLLSAAAGGGDPWPVAGAFLAAAGGLAAGRVASRAARWLVPAAVVAAAALLLLVAPQETLDPRFPLAGAFGYKNAAGAFFVQAAVAALMLAALVREAPARALAVACAGLFALVPLVSRSLAAATLVAAAPLVALAARGARGARAVIAACAGLLALALLVTAVLGAVHGDRPSGLGSVVDDALSERRLHLWHDALVLMGDHPLTGVGPGRFRETSPTAVADRDARWAHNGFLQQGAEGGVPGLLLLALLFLWGFARLWAAPSPDGVTALAAVALAALGVHATVDYVLHFPGLAVVAAALVGVGTAVEPGRGERP